MSKKEIQYYKIDVIITELNIKNNDSYLVDRFNKNVESIEEAVNYIKHLYPNINRESIYVNNEEKEAINTEFKFTDEKRKDLVDNIVRIDWVTITKVIEVEEFLTLEESNALIY